MVLVKRRSYPGRPNADRVRGVTDGRLDYIS